MTVKRSGVRNIGPLMEAVRKELGARVMLCTVYIADDGKLSILTYPGMNAAAAQRCADAMDEALGDIQIIDIRGN